MKPVITRVFALLAILTIAFGACAQTPPTTPAAPTVTYPSYFTSFGGGYVRSSAPPTEGFISTAIQVGANTGIYSITTVDMTAAGSTIRTGFGKIFAQSGNFTLLARVDAGISTTAPVIGSFSGGGILMYNLQGISSKLAGMYAFGEVRIMGASTTTAAVPGQVTPGFYVGIGKAF